jgi:hypothetical protein
MVTACGVIENTIPWRSGAFSRQAIAWNPMLGWLHEKMSDVTANTPVAALTRSAAIPQTPANQRITCNDRPMPCLDDRDKSATAVGPSG